jgi:hypothetical protein
MPGKQAHVAKIRGIKALAELACQFNRGSTVVQADPILAAKIG